MIASHYVIGELLEVFGDINELEDRFKKFADRYPSDPELTDIYNQFKEIKGKDKESLKPIEERLKELGAMRARESGGGSSLPFKDRRHLK